MSTIRALAFYISAHLAFDSSRHKTLLRSGRRSKAVLILPPSYSGPTFCNWGSVSDYVISPVTWPCSPPPEPNNLDPKPGSILSYTGSYWLPGVDEDTQRVDLTGTNNTTYE